MPNDDPIADRLRELGITTAKRVDVPDRITTSGPEILPPERHIEDSVFFSILDQGAPKTINAPPEEKP
jgi:hypothetical protein